MFSRPAFVPKNQKGRGIYGNLNIDGIIILTVVLNIDGLICGCGSANPDMGGQL